jgi:hypothetical protein
MRCRLDLSVLGHHIATGDQLLRRDMSEPQREQLTDLLDDIYDGFIATVASSRGKTVAVRRPGLACLGMTGVLPARCTGQLFAPVHERTPAADGSARRQLHNRLHGGQLAWQTVAVRKQGSAVCR